MGKTETNSGYQDHKIRAFLASSWDKAPPPSGGPSDLEITQRILKLMKKLAFFEVINQQDHQPRKVADKVSDGIDDADVVICVFTKRLHVLGPPEAYVPSPYVLTEAGYALGRYRNYEGMKRVVGFYEEGIDFAALGLYRDEGIDLEPFTRDKLDEAMPRFKEYLSQLPQVLRTGTGTGQMSLLRPPYRQLHVKKSVRMYRSGAGITRLRCQALVLDAQSLRSKGGIPHRIWTPRSSFPTLDTMLDGHVRNRLTEPVFTAVIVSCNHRRLNLPPTVVQNAHHGNSIEFFLIPPESLHVRDNDIIEYQYAWSLPGAFAPVEEKMGPLPFDEAALTSTHGTIRHAELVVEFEREARGVNRASPFSKEPFLLVSNKVGLDGPFSEPLPFPHVDENIWYLTYGWSAREFHGTIKACWRPVSESRWLGRRTRI